MSPQTAPSRTDAPTRTTVTLVGNPNVGKTTLFNRLCGLRAKATNLPGTTVEARRGSCRCDGQDIQVVDLPGVYSIGLDQPESRCAAACINGDLSGTPQPDVVLLVLDATNLARNLRIANEVLNTGARCVVALTMTDAASRKGLTLDASRIEAYLDCPVVPVIARNGTGIETLKASLAHARSTSASLPDPTDQQAVTQWSNGIVREAAGGEPGAAATGRLSDRLDLAFVHPVSGLLLFAAIMAGLFYVIFALAGIPMDLIELIFGHVGGWLSSVMPEGAIRDLVVDGIVGGLAGTVVFLPQILLLFFLISLLEDTGYLARAAFVMDRVMRRFGLPGQAFVPMLSAHACAIPAIMSARLVPDRRDRIAVILVAPFLSCSARLPVYVLLLGVLFAERPALAGLVFAGCYALGIIAALLSALLARRTLLKGRARPMVLELPAYRWPSLRTALLTAWDRGLLFIRKAGTVILGIVIVLWWLSAYPKYDASAGVASAQSDTTAIVETGGSDPAMTQLETEDAESRAAMAHSFAGRIGRFVQPVFEPLGYDWQLTVGVMTSFAAREVFVSTMAVLVSGSDDVDDPSVITRIEQARQDDGSPMLTPSTAASLLVFFVLAMQCLPTLAVTAREAGGWKWAILQLAWMTAVAWGAAWITRMLVQAGGLA
ncbi:MAG: ferrous iron transporter B [Phycisphaerales bacterium]|nr:ferrous iron transporter B [Phycisphaerales bacterium]